MKLLLDRCLSEIFDEERDGKLRSNVEVFGERLDKYRIVDVFRYGTGLNR